MTTAEPREVRLVRVGHRGARRLAAANTLLGFELARRHGVDMVEFDVSERSDGRLMLAHDRRAAERSALSLERALVALAAPPFTGLALCVDVKSVGIEAGVLRALRRHGVIDRCLLCARDPEVLRRARTPEPAVRRGWSLRWPHHRMLLAGRHRDLEDAARAAAAGGVATALVVHHRMVGPELVAAVLGEGAELYAWTINAPGHLRRMVDCGVTGVVSDDPRLFAAHGVAGRAPDWLRGAGPTNG